MKKTSITLAVVAIITAMTLTSCGGNDNQGMTDGTVNVETNKNDSGRVTDIIDNTAGDMK